MNGDPKVVAALAVAILALPPVVNAIMAKAADQADTSWLRDFDFDGQPDIDDPPPLEHTPPPGDLPPPDQQPPPDRPPPEDLPPCTPQSSGRQVPLQEGVTSSTGSFEITLEGRQRGVFAEVRGEGVTGTPTFTLLREGEEVWRYREQVLNADLEAVADAPEQEEAAPPERWTLTWNVRGVLYESFDLTLATAECVE